MDLTKINWNFKIVNDEIYQTINNNLSNLYNKFIGKNPIINSKLEFNYTVFVTTDENNPLIKEYFPNGAILGKDDYWLHTITIHNKIILIVYGTNNTAISYGIYEFLEEAGFFFLPSKETYQDKNNDKILFNNKLYKTVNPYRGMFFSFCMVATSIMSVTDFSQLFDRMMRLKLNKVVFYSFENEPIVDYSYNGERKIVGDISRKESGYLSYGKHFTDCFNVEDITIGKEYFKRKRVAPMEFQDINSSTQALDQGKNFFQKIIEEANKRGIGVWLSILPQFVSMNMAKYIKPMPRKNLHWSALVSCEDETAKKINQARIDNIMNSYNDLEGIYIGIPEGFFDDPHEVSRNYIKEHWDEYTQSFELQQKYWGDHWKGYEKQKKHMEADIAFSKITIEVIEYIREKYSDKKVGVSAICKSYLLTKLHNVLPNDVIFMDIESRSLWTHQGAPLFLFNKMEKRDNLLIPRVIDDGSQLGMQFNIELYYKDQFGEAHTKYHTKGLIMQMLAIRGSEHNVRYLADVQWDKRVKPNEFYLYYLTEVYGKKAYQIMNKAYKILEENEQFMGGRGASNMPWNHVPPEIVIIRDFQKFNNPFFSCPITDDYIDFAKSRIDIYEQSIKNLDKATKIINKSLALCHNNGIKEAKYLLARTLAYKNHLETLTMIYKLYKQYRDVFNKRSEIKNNINELLLKAELVEKQAINSAKILTTCIEHTTDLALLWMVNSSMIKGTLVLRQFIQYIWSYHHGYEYDELVDFNQLFGTCPYPAHEVISDHIKKDYLEEPG